MLNRKITVRYERNFEAASVSDVLQSPLANRGKAKPEIIYLGELLVECMT